ncbi:MAG: hypothetical protein V5A68_02060 [Candidatus Thermoplasmatota archaeon]
MDNKKSTLLTVVIVSFLLVFSAVCTIAQKTKDVQSVNKHEININDAEGKFSVEESLNFKSKEEMNESYNSLTFWLPNEAKESYFIVNGNEVEDTEKTGNLFNVNISGLNVSKAEELKVTISYSLDREKVVFEKNITYNTSSLTVFFNDEKIFSSMNVKNNSFFSLKLYKPSERPLSWYTILAFSLLIVVLIVATFYSFRKGKSSSKINYDRSGSKEYLNLKKSLLTSLLKEVEKKHRSDKISDDTYHKLKDQYKTEAISVMKRLEEIESEGK